MGEKMLGKEDKKDEKEEEGGGIITSLKPNWFF